MAYIGTSPLRNRRPQKSLPSSARISQLLSLPYNAKLGRNTLPYVGRRPRSACGPEAGHWSWIDASGRRVSFDTEENDWIRDYDDEEATHSSHTHRRAASAFQ